MSGSLDGSSEGAIAAGEDQPGGDHVVRELIRLDPRGMLLLWKWAQAWSLRQEWVKDMLAWQIIRTHEPFVLNDVPEPVAGHYAGFGTTTAAATESVRLGGRVVQVGMGLEATISTKWLILKAVTLIGSQGGTIEDVQGCYDFFATGRIDPAITEISFEQIPGGLEKLKKGDDVVGRLVAVYA